MHKFSLKDFTGGWVLGNFKPSLNSGEVDFEFGVKFFNAGDVEPCHFQRVATEYSIVVSGICRIGTYELTQGQGLEIPPGEIADFEAISDCAIAVVKMPSSPSDKILCDEI